jgi:hypothetical protein
MHDDLVVDTPEPTSLILPLARSGAHNTRGSSEIGPPLPFRRIRVFRPLPVGSALSQRVYNAVRDHPKKNSKQITALIGGVSKRQVSRAFFLLLAEGYLYRHPAKRIYTVTPKAAPCADPKQQPLFDRRKFALKKLESKVNPRLTTGVGKN